MLSTFFKSQAANTAMILFFITTLCIMGCAPYITSLSPTSGTQGTEVTINGGKFANTPTENTVKFTTSTVPTSDITVLSSSVIKAKVPTGAITGLVSVQTSKGTGYSKQNFVIPSGTSWTFIVYLDADNNLEPFGLNDFMEMASVGSNTDVNIVVQMDRINGYSSSYGNWTGTRRFLIQNGDTPSSTPIQDLGEQNMGDPNTLQDFVEWAIVNYPADHYLLSIWNHGDGWRQNREMFSSFALNRTSGANETLVKSVASDDTDGDILYLREVQDALKSARQGLEARYNTNVKLDVIGFDACYMGMVEVAFALRDVTNYMVASEDLEPGPGWPYNTILADLLSNPNMNAEDVAKSIVTNYGNAYSSGITQAAYDMAKINDLAKKIDAFTSKANTEWNMLKNARSNSREYHYPGYNTTWGVDIWDFGNKVYNNASNVDLKNAATQLKNAVDDFVIEEHHSSDRVGSHGVAIYFPPNSTSFNNDPQHTGYQESNSFMKVDFVTYHKWDNWLPDFYGNIP